MQVKGKLSIGGALLMGDEDFRIFAMGKSRIAKALLTALDKRELYKVAFTSDKKIDKEALLKKTKLKPHELLISTVSLGRFAFSIPVDDNGELKDIRDLSKTARNLEEETKRLEAAVVCVPARYKERVAIALGN